MVGVNRRRCEVILLRTSVSGEHVAQWPSTTGKMIQRRGADRNFGQSVVHLHYPDAGHTAGGVPGAPAATEVLHPLTGGYYALDGTLPGTPQHVRGHGRTWCASSRTHWAARANPALLDRPRLSEANKGAGRSRATQQTSVPHPAQKQELEVPMTLRAVCTASANARPASAGASLRRNVRNARLAGMPGSTSALRRRGVRLEGLTIGWNSLEALVAVVGGITASSVALVGFGLDSVIEVGAAVVVLWQFIGIAEEREKRALKLIGGSFFVLAAYIVYSSVNDLLRQSKPEASIIGIVLTALALVVMPLLARSKRRTATELGSRTLLADSKQSSLCAYLSLSTLVGLVLNAAFGLWWADPAAGLFIAFVAVREGRQAWAGEIDDCC